MGCAGALCIGAAWGISLPFSGSSQRSAVLREEESLNLCSDEPRAPGGGGRASPPHPGRGEGSALPERARSPRRSSVSPQPRRAGLAAPCAPPPALLPLFTRARGAAELGQVPPWPSRSGARAKPGRHVRGGEGEAGAERTRAAFVNSRCGRSRNNSFLGFGVFFSSFLPS